jgi:hypothetical protein
VLVVLGALVALACNAGRHSERFLSFAVSDRSRFCHGIKARPVDPARYKRGIKACLAFAIVMGLLIVVLGVVTLI